MNGDWSFKMTGLSGSYDFFVSSDRPPPMVVATRVVVDGTSYPAAVGIALAEGDHNVVVFVAPREAPKSTVDNTHTAGALVEQFKNEKVFWKQIEIAKAIAGKHDASVLPPLPTGLVIRIVTSAATSRSSSPASAIRADFRFGALVTVSEAAKAAIAKLQ